MKRTIITNMIIFILLISIAAFTQNTSSITAFSTNDNVIRHGNLSSKNVCLMVNVYWGTDYIPQMLNIFREYNITTTFFVGGTWVNKNQELFESIVEAGHEIGNHGFFHKDGGKLSYLENLEEIQSTHNLVKSLSGINMNLFAPPSGTYGDATMQACENLGYKAILWTYDTIDWRDKDSNLIFTRATKNMAGGNLILMHPTQSTIDALPNIISKYISNGYTLTTVSKTLE